MTDRRETPKRFPPPLGRVTRGKDGLIYPVTEPGVIECGQLARLNGVGLVVCIRPVGHTVALNYGHSNGYVEWCFDTGPGSYAEIPNPDHKPLEPYEVVD